jgi:cytochrome P450
MRVLGGVLGPIIAQGVILRRPPVTALADRLQVDRRAARVLRRLEERYGPGPVRLAVPGRSIAMVLDAADVRRLLQESPTPFAPAAREKRAALRHFQPNGVLISTGAARTERRALNEAALRPDLALHPLGTRLAAVVNDELSALLDRARDERRLTWPAFTGAFTRAVRRISLGDAAAADDRVTDLVNRLRADANWAFLHPRRRRVQAELADRLQSYVDHAEPATLAELLANVPSAPGTDPAGQLPHWLFAFDAVGIATYRVLAVLTADPALARRARDESGVGALDVPYLRACVLESVRLWPTTLVILRESTAPTDWPSGTLPTGTLFAVTSSYGHRDERRLPYADRFEPEAWLDGRAESEPGIVPFSAGPARCPGEQLVLLTASLTLGRLLTGADLRPRRRLDPTSLPRTLDHAGLVLDVR